jgi:phage repressor protein C with HTH and peptisase S24 domain
MTGLSRVENLSEAAELIEALLGEGLDVAFVAKGTSMLPAIRPGDRLRVRRLDAPVRRGDIVLARSEAGLTAHRVKRIAADGARTVVVTRGDWHAVEDPPVEPAAILGRVVEVRRDGRAVRLGRRRPLAAVARGIARRLGPFGGGTLSTSTL